MANGLLVIISSPSGGGKDTVINELTKRIQGSTRLVTTTTRQPREGETDGVQYNFISEQEFKKRIENGEFLEHNRYAEHYYGSERKVLERTLSKNKVVFTLIEVNGKRNLDKAGIKNLSIFLVPESLEILKKRIIERGGVSPELIKERLETAERELKEAKSYDFQVVNKEGKLPQTVDEIGKILQKELENR
jgi:guanylate kinase